MVVRGKPTARRTAAKKPAATTRRATPQRATATKTATTTRETAPKAASKSRQSEPPYDVDKLPTDYHKQFARWIMKQCGYDPEGAKSKTIAFLYGVSIATASRPVFMKSEELATWREETGQAKRGPKPKTENARRKSQRQNVSDDEFEDDSEEFEDEEDFEDETDANDEEFDEDSDEDEDDDEFEDDSEEDDDEFEDDEEEEPEPPKRRAKSAASRGRSGSTRGTTSTRRTPASKTRTTRGKAKPQDDDDFVF